jgi:hypothetical protein
MQLTKYPKNDRNPYGYIELLPNGFDPTKFYPLVVHLHGNGGNGNGSEADLEKLVRGELPEEIQKAVDVFKFICIATQVDTYSDGEVDHAIGNAVRALPININKRYLLGTSFGGGRLTRWLSKSVENAKKFAGAASSCGLNWLSTPKNIADAGLPIIFFHAQDDGTVGVAATNSAVSSINQYSMLVPAKKVLYETGQHWIWNKVFHSTERPWVGNETPRTLWDYLLMLEAGKPVPVPMRIPSVEMIIDAGPDQVVSTQYAKLTGSNSTNYKSISWRATRYPSNVNPWGIFYKGAGWHTVDVLLENEGAYEFELTGTDANGAILKDTVQVNYLKPTTPPVPEMFKPTHIIHYANGDKESIIIETL